MSYNLVQALLKEAKEQKPVVDKLNELSVSLLDLIPWHTREGLDKLVTEDNERYKAVCDAITRQVDQINADLLRSQKVNLKFASNFYLICFSSIIVIINDKELNMFSNQNDFCLLTVRRGCRL